MSTSAAATPALASAADAAFAAIASTVSSSPAMWRVAMPTRLRIHSSLVSTIFDRSSAPTSYSSRTSSVISGNFHRLIPMHSRRPSTLSSPPARLE